MHRRWIRTHKNELLPDSQKGQIDEKLDKRERTLKLVPGLVTEWTQVSPPLCLKFQDGTPLTAERVVLSVNRPHWPDLAGSTYACAVRRSRPSTSKPSRPN